ncbi:PAQR family membrane homeostasis protein TrhA [Novipirellula galeiformis]|uniref:PAQR family membrane homeostasis protein TrhA n=1 Tax=Novipirellula galeiformis TaxID=2528004 RepID=UPI001E4F2FFB|nr:hemolysin III family protein [Novipirellula galeiformis]
MNFKETTTLDLGDAPIKLDQEWANALTHGIAAVISAIAAVFLVRETINVSQGAAIACTAYMASVIGTFVSSTLSHMILRQPMLDHLRAWDQAMIYTMISGTYTPIVYAYAPDGVRQPLLIAIWVAAAIGFFGKVLLRHRVNSIGTVSYLLLGWLPAIPLAGYVPSALVTSMIAGGVLYSIGVVLLINDSKIRYLHAGWHLFVMLAATCHFLGIWWYTF